MLKYTVFTQREVATVVHKYFFSNNENEEFLFKFLIEPRFSRQYSEKQKPTYFQFNPSISFSFFSLSFIYKFLTKLICFFVMLNAIALLILATL